MSLKRKGNPRFALGVDSLGRPAWRVKPSSVNGAGLRDALHDDEVRVSDLPRQLTEGETERVETYIEIRLPQMRSEQAAWLLADPVARTSLGAAGMGVTGTLLAFGVPAVAAPLAALTAVVLTAATLRQYLMERRAKNEVVEDFVGGNGNHRHEAKKMAARFPHWYDGDRPATKMTTTMGDFVVQYEATCRVSPTGVGEVAWKSKRRAGRRQSGTYFVYPGVDLHEGRFACPAYLPGVNARGADLGHTRLPCGSVFDGADFRNANVSFSTWDASLKYANCQNANFSGVDFRRCNVDGADFTGADLTGALLPVDLTGTNLTREQFVSLSGVEAEASGGGYANFSIGYRVPEVTVDEVVAAWGGDREAVAVAMWAGELEVRERATSKPVQGEFNPELHYIPRWAIDEPASV